LPKIWWLPFLGHGVVFSAVSTWHTHRRSADLLCRRSDRLEFTACRTAWTDCKQRCLSAHIEDDLVREILVHRAQLRCFAWNCAV